jgi:hypothetical protein
MRLGIRANDPAAIERARALLPHGARPSASPLVDSIYSLVVNPQERSTNIRRFNLLYSDHVRVLRSSNIDHVFDTLESHLRLTVAELARNRVFVHAGVVGWNGKAILIPGRTFTGKSTLVAELVKAGAKYYSDEYAVIDSRGLVYPFNKPIEMRNPDATQTKVNVASFGGKVGRKPLPVGLVLSTRYRDGAKWRPRVLSGGKAFLELFSNTISARRYPERTLEALANVTATAKVLKGVRGDAKELIATLLVK